LDGGIVVAWLKPGFHWQ